MKSAIIYCSKTGNTHKVATAIQQGLGNAADLLRLDLTPEGLLKTHLPGFTYDLSGYDVVFLGGWVMVMHMHPFIAAYINQVDSLAGLPVVGFFTGGASLSRGHVQEDFTSMLKRRDAQVFDFIYLTTLLGPLLTPAKLRRADAFARSTAARIAMDTTA